MEKVKTIVLDAKDNVATVLDDIARGETIDIDTCGNIVKLTATDFIPFAHKIAILDIPEGAEVIKYGEAIGRATKTIRRGEHVHVKTVVSIRGRGDIEKRWSKAHESPIS